MSAHRAWPLYVMAVLWLRYLTEINKSTEEVPAELLENEQTRKAISLVEKSAMSEGQLYAYELLDVYPRRGGPHRDKIFYDATIDAQTGRVLSYSMGIA